MKGYTSDALEHGVHLTQGGLVLVALLCGGDYSVGRQYFEKIIHY